MVVEVGNLAIDDVDEEEEDMEPVSESEEFDELGDIDDVDDGEALGDNDSQSVCEGTEVTAESRLAVLYLPEPTDRSRPTVRRDCLKGGSNEQRPCRWSKCHHHLGFGKRSSCTLDVADEGGTSLEEVGELLGLTRERIQQLEFVALRKTKKHLLLIGVTLEDFARDPSKVQER
jgi:hypothetical protein